MDRLDAGREPLAAALVRLVDAHVVEHVHQRRLLPHRRLVELGRDGLRTRRVHALAEARGLHGRRDLREELRAVVAAAPVEEFELPLRAAPVVEARLEDLERAQGLIDLELSHGRQGGGGEPELLGLLQQARDPLQLHHVDVRRGDLQVRRVDRRVREGEDGLQVQLEHVGGDAGLPAAVHQLFPRLVGLAVVALGRPPGDHRAVHLGRERVRVPMPQVVEDALGLGGVAGEAQGLHHQGVRARRRLHLVRAERVVHLPVDARRARVPTREERAHQGVVVRHRRASLDARVGEVEQARRLASARRAVPVGGALLRLERVVVGLCLAQHRDDVVRRERLDLPRERQRVQPPALHEVVDDRRRDVGERVAVERFAVLQQRERRLRGPFRVTEGGDVRRVPVDKRLTLVAEGALGSLGVALEPEQRDAAVRGGHPARVVDAGVLEDHGLPHGHVEHPVVEPRRWVV
mmetsp:Transcript_32965/g.101832  ORF Transcript_32965/g.101832 Transcript_32965/m.101832 type:complete len:463 (-) Transcript_32965:125-1513(-)